jgi:hypothetical protein
MWTKNNDVQDAWHSLLTIYEGKALEMPISNKPMQIFQSQCGPETPD